jgi:hypothetical protein
VAQKRTKKETIDWTKQNGKRKEKDVKTVPRE